MKGSIHDGDRIDASLVPSHWIGEQDSQTITLILRATFHRPVASKKKNAEQVQCSYSSFLYNITTKLCMVRSNMIHESEGKSTRNKTRLPCDEISTIERRDMKTVFKKILAQ